jgi:hypothetical protein
MGGAEINDPFTPEFAEFVAETMDEWKLLGTSIAVVDGDEVFSQVRSTRVNFKISSF